jgi:hypothetical protein
VEEQFFAGLEVGRDALRDLHETMSAAMLEELLSDTAEAAAEQARINELLAGCMSDTDEREAARELAEMELALADADAAAAAADPKVIAADTKITTDPKADIADPEATADAADPGVDPRLLDLPDVPTTAPQTAHAESEESETEPAIAAQSKDKAEKKKKKQQQQQQQPSKPRAKETREAALA